MLVFQGVDLTQIIPQSLILSSQMISRCPKMSTPLTGTAVTRAFFVQDEAFSFVQDFPEMNLGTMKSSLDPGYTPANYGLPTY